MKFFTAVLFSFFLSACAPLGEAPSPPAESVRLVAEQPRLRAAAAGVLRRAGVRVAQNFSAPEMRIREQTGEEVESVGADGAPNFYAVRYQLAFSFNGAPERLISESRIVPHEESRYLAERRRRRAVVDDLRGRALNEMMYRLQREAAE